MATPLGLRNRQDYSPTGSTPVSGAGASPSSPAARLGVRRRRARSGKRASPSPSRSPRAARGWGEAR